MRESLRQRWPEIRALLEAAVAQPRAERARFVDIHAADPALAAAVHELLAAEDPATLAETPAVASVDLRGARLGPFRLDCRIGAGGMGEVWRAERVEGGIAQTVAIKLLHAGLDQGEGGRRFAQERQILAELDHPSIARLIDGGLSPDGRLWYAMELVDGDSITAYAERHALTVRARVQLPQRGGDVRDGGVRDGRVRRGLRRLQHEPRRRLRGDARDEYAPLRCVRARVQLPERGGDVRDGHVRDGRVRRGLR